MTRMWPVSATQTPTRSVVCPHVRQAVWTPLHSPAREAPCARLHGEAGLEGQCRGALSPGGEARPLHLRPRAAPWALASSHSPSRAAGALLHPTGPASVFRPLGEARGQRLGGQRWGAAEDLSSPRHPGQGGTSVPVPSHESGCHASLLTKSEAAPRA